MPTGLKAYPGYWKGYIHNIQMALMSNYDVTFLASRVYLSSPLRQSPARLIFVYLSLYLSIYIYSLFRVCRSVKRILIVFYIILIKTVFFFHSQPQSSFGRPSTLTGPPTTLNGPRRHDFCLPIGHWPHPLPAEVPEDPIEVFRRSETTFTEVVLHAPPPPTSSAPGSGDEKTE